MLRPGSNTHRIAAHLSICPTLRLCPDSEPPNKLNDDKEPGRPGLAQRACQSRLGRETKTGMPYNVAIKSSHRAGVLSPLALLLLTFLRVLPSWSTTALSLAIALPLSFSHAVPCTSRPHTLCPCVRVARRPTRTKYFGNQIRVPPTAQRSTRKQPERFAQTPDMLTVGFGRVR